MSSSIDYLDFVLERLSIIDNITYRPMMGEYIIYHQGIVIGGIYDNRFLIKLTKSIIEMFPNPIKEIPYEGAKEMLLVDFIEEDQLLKAAIDVVTADLKNKK